MEELCNVAESLIVPVRMGIARPTAPFTLASTSIDAVQGSEELFSVEPLPPRPSPDQSSRSVGFRALIFLNFPHRLLWQLLTIYYHCVMEDCNVLILYQVVGWVRASS